MYVFDNGPISELKHFFPTIFTSLWDRLDALAHGGVITSTREVMREAENGNPTPHVAEWVKRHNKIFSVPTPAEMRIVADIFKTPHFQALIGEKQRLRGTPVADPFVIAAAEARGFTVVTSERFKPNAVKIPNVCEQRNIRYLDLEGFMAEQGMNF